MTGSGIAFHDHLAWNAYPWYINGKPSAAKLELAMPLLHRLIEMCPQLQVIIVHGGDAQRAWRMYWGRYPTIVCGLRVVETYQTSRQALWPRGPGRAAGTRQQAVRRLR